MESPNWLRVIILGIVLAILAFGYFFLTNRFVLNGGQKNTNTTNTEVVQSTPNPTAGNNVLGIVEQPSLTPEPKSAFETVAERNKAQVTELPKTGAPIFFITLGSISAMIVGLSLRKFPN